MKNGYSLLSVLLIAVGLNAQTSNPLYIGSCDNDQMSEAVQQGAYIYGIGTTYSFGATAGDIYLFKADTSGNRIWCKRMGTGPNEDVGTSIAVNGNNLVITGKIPHEEGSVLVSWLDTSGTLLQSIVLNDPGCTLLSAVQKNTGGALFCGFIVTSGHYSPIVLSTDVAGNIIWSKKIGNAMPADSTEGNGLATSLIELGDGTILVTGSTMKNNTTSPFIIKLDSNGDLLWDHTYNMACTDGNGNILVTPAGDIVVCGSTPRSPETGSDPFILKTSSSGELIYSYVYYIDQTAGPSTAMTRVRLTMSGSNLLLTGSVASSYTATDGDCFALYLDANGNIDWVKKYGNASGNVARCGLAIPGNIILAGYSQENEDGNTVVGHAQQDLMLLTVKTDGTSPMANTDLLMNANVFVTDTVNNALSVDDYNYVPTTFSPQWYSEQTTYDSLSCFGLQVAEAFETINGGMMVYPNPAIAYAEVVIKDLVNSFDIYVYNATGELVTSQSNILNGKAMIDVSGFEPGIYIVTARSNDRILGSQRLAVN